MNECGWKFKYENVTQGLIIMITMINHVLIA